MNQKQARVVVGAVALVFGVGAIIGMKSIMSKPQVVQKVQVTNTEQVLVARSNIGLGEVATSNSFRWMAWPKEAIGPHYIRLSRAPRAMKDYSGSIARAPIMVGEPIAPQKLIKAGEGGVLASILPSGMRAISTEIRDRTAAGSLILPNDHVDVILTRKMTSRGNEEHVVDTLFTNVRVLAIGQQIEVKEGKKSASNGTTTATLELTPRQAELMALANKMGEISLALRSVADFGTGKGPSSGKDLSSQRGNAIKVLRYGVKSRAYGVN